MAYNWSQMCVTFAINKMEIIGVIYTFGCNHRKMNIINIVQAYIPFEHQSKQITPVFLRRH